MNPVMETNLRVEVLNQYFAKNTGLVRLTNKSHIIILSQDPKIRCRIAEFDSQSPQLLHFQVIAA